MYMQVAHEGCMFFDIFGGSVERWVGDTKPRVFCGPIKQYINKAIWILDGYHCTDKEITLDIPEGNLNKIGHPSWKTIIFS